MRGSEDAEMLWTEEAAAPSDSLAGSCTAREPTRNTAFVTLRAGSGSPELRNNPAVWSTAVTSTVARYSSGWSEV